MRAVRRQATGPERMLHSAFRALHLRFSKNSRNLPGSPDIVFRENRVAVFVHGCFWHRHRNCSRATTPRSNIPYWRAKFAANLERDRETLSQLNKLGWKVIVLWQCDIEADAMKAARRVCSVLVPARKARPPLSGLSSSKPARFP